MADLARHESHVQPLWCRLPYGREAFKLYRMTMSSLFTSWSDVKHVPGDGGGDELADGYSSMTHACISCGMPIHTAVVLSNRLRRCMRAISDVVDEGSFFGGDRYVPS